jgi:hypothetical protein
MKSVFGAGWGRRTPGGIGAPQQQQPIDPRYTLTPELFDPFLKGAKQVKIDKKKLPKNICY